MGALDGLTILRYGHNYDGGGGMEQYLRDLNGVLAERNQFTTIQVQMTSQRERVGEAEETLGRGRFVRVSMFVDQASHERAIGEAEEPSTASCCKDWLRDRVLYAPGIYPMITRRWLRRRRVPRRAGEPDGAGETVRALHKRFPLDLICLHTAGGADVAEILEVAQSESIPVGYVHHFSNDRLCGFSMRGQLEQMGPVAGVCEVDVPRFLRGRFHNVSDGIDTEFFRREKARPLGRSFAGPLIFLPARITPSKGQADLIRAAGELKRRGLKFHVALAGRTESAAFLEELKQLIRTEGVEGSVEFVGQLGPEELRDWYAAAAVMAFPTLHHEGLGRISVEAQALQTPVVVYSIGGTPEGLRDQATGFLVPAGDVNGLVDRLAQLLQDEELRRRMGEAGRRFVEEQFSLAALAERHERYYLRVLGGRKSQRMKPACGASNVS